MSTATVFKYLEFLTFIAVFGFIVGFPITYSTIATGSSALIQSGYSMSGREEWLLSISEIISYHLICLIFWSAYLGLGGPYSSVFIMIALLARWCLCFSVAGLHFKTE